MSLKVKGLGVAAAAVSSLMAATAAHAIQPPNLLTNGSFESDANFKSGSHTGDDTLLQGSTAMPGWTVVGFGEVGWFSPDVNLPQTNYDITASDGSYSVDLTGNTDLRGGFGGVQTKIATVKGETYQLTFDLGSDSQYGLPVGLRVTAGDLDETVSSSLSNQKDSNANAWAPQSFSFVAGSNLTVLTFQGTAGSEYIGLDNVVVTGTPGAAVPEPAAWALMMLGFGGCGALLRRHRTSRFAAAL